MWISGATIPFLHEFTLSPLYAQRPHYRDRNLKNWTCTWRRLNHLKVIQGAVRLLRQPPTISLTGVAHEDKDDSAKTSIKHTEASNVNVLIFHRAEREMINHGLIESWEGKESEEVGTISSDSAQLFPSSPSFSKCPLSTGQFGWLWMGSDVAENRDGYLWCLWS